MADYPADWRTGVAYLRAVLTDDTKAIRVIQDSAGLDELLAAVTAVAVRLGAPDGDVEALDLDLHVMLLTGSLLS